MPPTGRTLPVNETSPVIARFCLTGTPVANDNKAVTMVQPALGPSFGVAPCSIHNLRHWHKTLTHDITDVGLVINSLGLNMHHALQLGASWWVLLLHLCFKKNYTLFIFAITFLFMNQFHNFWQKCSRGNCCHGRKIHEIKGTQNYVFYRCRALRACYWQFKCLTVENQLKCCWCSRKHVFNAEDRILVEDLYKFKSYRAKNIVNFLTNIGLLMVWIIYWRNWETLVPQLGNQEVDDVRVRVQWKTLILWMTWFWAIKVH